MDYKIIFLPILAGFIAQVIKFSIRSNNQRFRLKNILAYSGMPSGHSALVVSLATIVGLTEGPESSVFAISLILATIVIRDAIGIRRYLGEHGKTLNILVKDLKEDEFLDEHYPHMLERIGHTPLQIIAGSIIGFLVSLTGFYLL